jgi:hypothetical protein
MADELMWNELISYIHIFDWRGLTLLASVDISTCAIWITQNEQRFVAGEIPHELDAQMEGH